MTKKLQVPESAYRYLEYLGKLWGADIMSSTLTLRISSRMISSLGSYRPDKDTISLNRTLMDQRNSSILKEILCHEAAHAAVLSIHGNGCKPHGREWKELMKTAQYVPRARIPGNQIHSRPGAGKSVRYRYTHMCLDCGRIFRSWRTDRRWRCKSCMNLGLDGFLKMVKRDKR